MFYKIIHIKKKKSSLDIRIYKKSYYIISIINISNVI